MHARNTLLKGLIPIKLAAQARKRGHHGSIGIPLVVDRWNLKGAITRVGTTVYEKIDTRDVACGSDAKNMTALVTSTNSPTRRIGVLLAIQR